VEYLTGRLMPDERDLFESRCLQAPDLQRRVDDARRLMPVAQSRRAPLLSRWTLAVATLLIVAAGAATLIYRQPPLQRAALHSPPNQGNDRLVTIVLNPGVSMGQGAQEVQAALAPNSTLELVLNLPGHAFAVSAPVTISLIGADGRLQPIWTAARPIESKPAQGGQTLAFRLDSKTFRTGDYAVQVGTAGDLIHETFLFRVVPTQ
jgi:hypothetical protein